MGIKNHDSESQGQEEIAIITQNKKYATALSELFTRKSVQKISTALLKLP